MKSPSFNFYPNNWLASGRLATMLPEQEGAYVRLLCYQWNSEDQTIPEDDRQLAMLSRLSERWQTLGRDVKQCFDKVPELAGRLRNERLWHEYNRIQGLRDKKSSGGKTAMAHRWNKKEDDKTVISVLQESNKTVITGNREQGTGSLEAKTETEKKEDTRGALLSFGEFKRVRLSASDYEKLSAVYGSDMEKAIDVLDGYLEQGGGKKYKNHYAVLRRPSWVYDRVKGGGSTHPEKQREVSTVWHGKTLDPKLRGSFGDKTQ